MHWYFDVLRKYATFSGRARRKEYWLFGLIHALIIGLLLALGGVTGAASAQRGVVLFTGLYILAMLVPNIAVTVRRLHDTDHSAWWLLIGAVPLIGGIVFLVLMARDGDPGQNKYGPDPKQFSSSPAGTAAKGAGLQSDVPVVDATCANCGMRLSRIATRCLKCGERRAA